MADTTSHDDGAVQPDPPRLNPLQRLRWWYRSRRFLERTVREQLDQIRRLEEALRSK